MSGPYTGAASLGSTRRRDANYVTVTTRDGCMTFAGDSYRFGQRTRPAAQNHGRYVTSALTRPLTAAAHLRMSFPRVFVAREHDLQHEVNSLFGSFDGVGRELRAHVRRENRMRNGWPAESASLLDAERRLLVEHGFRRARLRVRRTTLRQRATSTIFRGLHARTPMAMVGGSAGTAATGSSRCALPSDACCSGRR